MATGIFAAALRRPYVLVVLAAVLPRLGVLLIERDDILASYTEKSDDFARTLVASGTFGLTPGIPSASTQPLYAFFLTPLYWLLGRHWAVVGLAQVAVAAAAACLVYLVALRVVQSKRLAVVAGVVTTLEPYAVWHDVHVNREILDAPLAAGVVLCTLAVAERPTLRRWSFLGLACGVAILGNIRLLALPVALLAFIVWRARPLKELLAGAALAVACGALVLVPWTARNAAQVGCFTLTTDSLALWKANNPRTYETLARGGWIDDVLPRLPVEAILRNRVSSPLGTEVVLGGGRVPVTPEDAARVRRVSGVTLPVDECAQMRHYRHEVFAFWRDDPLEKGRLAVQATGMLWAPQVPATEGRPGAGTIVDRGRSLAEPLFVLPLYVLAAAGLVSVRRWFAVLAVVLVGYQTLAAAIFAGTTRYRGAWDFVIVLLAVAGARRLLPVLRDQRPVQGIESLGRTVGSEGG